MPQMSNCRPLFQSTRPAWGATLASMIQRSSTEISIHAPRVGRDSAAHAKTSLIPYFNPRAPRGARRGAETIISFISRFQSTRPAWGATRGGVYGTLGGQISIHAPRVGRDEDIRVTMRGMCISIHAPRVGRDQAVQLLMLYGIDFNPRAPRGARQRSQRICAHPCHFNPRAPRGARRRQGER